MASGSNIGIMDEAYFVGRKQILAWINDTFSLNVAKIEDTASGAVACQIADAIFPGSVPMSKVKWDARSDYEFINNYKILQRAFQNNQVDKHVEVEKLIRAKYQDNLEFMQWMKRFYELNNAGGEYDPVARRSRGKGAPASTGGGSGGGGGGGGARAAPRRERDAPAGGAKAKVAAAGKPKPAASRVDTGRSNRGAQPRRDASLAEAKKMEDMTTQVTELKLSVDGLEKERDFYFGKLRDIEILLQSVGGEDGSGAVGEKGPQLVQQIFKILYATEDDFVIVDDEDGDADGKADEGTLEA